MRLKLPTGLHYPITVKELIKQPNDQVKRSEPIFSYTYLTQVPQYDREGNETFIEQTFSSRFESSADGALQRWFLRKGEVVSNSGYVNLHHGIFSWLRILNVLQW